MSPRTAIPAIAILILAAAVATAQVSFEEAQRRLHDKLATKPSSTQPVSESDRLRSENRRLREENLSLQREVSQLRDALASAVGNATPTTGPAATRPTASGSGPQTQPGSDLATRILGRWHGGTIASGNAFTLEFQPEGEYVQSWVVSPRSDRGHYALAPGDLLEMWTGNAPRHNQYHASVAGGELTLTPLAIAGGDVPRGKPMVLKSEP